MTATTGRKWLTAGVRATPEERERHRRKLVAERHRSAAAREADDRVAYQRWRDGLVVPYLITLALDAAGLQGPEVDARCRAREPEVDQWEAGELYPTWEQLCALAALTWVTPRFLTAGDTQPPPALWETSIWFHMTAAERKAAQRDYRPPVARYPRAVLDERPPSPGTMPPA